VDELEADFSPASGSELGWAENAVGAARAQRRCAERAERAAAENGRARRAWVDGDGVPVGHTGRPRNGNEGEGLPDDRRRRSGPRAARGRPRRGGESRELDSRGRVCGGQCGGAARCAGCCALVPDGGTRSVSQRGAATARTVASRQASLGGQGNLSAPRSSAIIIGTVGRWWPRAVRRGCRGDPPVACLRDAGSTTETGRSIRRCVARSGMAGGRPFWLRRSAAGVSAGQPGGRSAAPLRFCFDLARRVIATTVRLSGAPTRQMTDLPGRRPSSVLPRSSRRFASTVALLRLMR